MIFDHFGCYIYDPNTIIIRFEGTRVTIETFLKWRQQFEEEMGIDKKRELIDKEGRKLTGKQHPLIIEYMSTSIYLQHIKCI